jgi:hypothetical protein
VKRHIVLVGGPHHGSVVELPEGVTAWRTLESSGDDTADTITAHTIRRAWYVFPGRTAAQFFDVVGAEAGLGCPGAGRFDIVADAALTAWRNGWAPPETPDLPPSFFVHGGTAWIGGPL